MVLIRAFGILLIVLGAGWLAVSTGAISSIDADRTSELSVAGDNSALVGLDVEKPVDAGGGSTLVTVTNNADETLIVEISLTTNTDPGVSIPNGQQEAIILPEESAEFTVNVNPSQQPETIEFDLNAADESNDGISVSLTRSTTVEGIDIGACTGPRQVFDQNVNDDIDVKNGSAVLSSNVKVTGDSDVDAADCVIAKNKSQIGGDVSAGAEVRLGENARIKGSVEAGGDVSLGKNARVNDELTAGGGLDLGENARINGDVSIGSNTTLSMGPNSRISGEAEAEDPSTVTIECASGATIDGTPCSSYTFD